MSAYVLVRVCVRLFADLFYEWGWSVNAAQTPLQSHYAGVFFFGTYTLLAQFYHDLLGSYLANGTAGACSSSSACGPVRAAVCVSVCVSVCVCVCVRTSVCLWCVGAWVYVQGAACWSVYAP
jgi:hypothetical protein